MNIHEWNERRARAKRMVDALAMLNQPTDADEALAADARLRLAIDAWHATERDYREALARMTTDELIAVAG